MDQVADLTQLAPPSDIAVDDRRTVFEHIYRRLAARRNTFELWAAAETATTDADDASNEEFIRAVDVWANELLENAWVACAVTEKGPRLPS